MSNTHIQWIENRRSFSKLIEPAPNQMQINQAIHCAMTAPDHRKLKPWRFIVSEGKAREELGEVFLQSAIAQAKQKGETLNDTEQQKFLNMPLRSPLIITVVTSMQYHEKVPEFEQLLSAGACVQNLILALKAQGFASIWRTGDFTNEPVTKDYFGVGTEDYITGFIYIGTAMASRPERKPILLDEYVTFK